MSQHKQQCFPDSKVQVVTICSESDKNCKKTAYLFDEADDVIDNHALCCHDGKLGSSMVGLMTLQNTKHAFFFSATTTPFHNKFLKNYFKVQDSDIYHFKSASQVNDNTASNSSNIPK